MAETVYMLCALTSLSCALLLARGWRRTGTRLLLWSALCFGGLFVDNLALVLDMVVYPDVNMVGMRDVTRLIALAGIGCLLYGMVLDDGRIR
jgi:hypothetical protein